MEYLRRSAEATERASAAMVATTQKIEAIIAAAGGVEGIKAKLALLNLFSSK